MKKSFEHAQHRREEGVRYKHDLGQHFLYDEALLRSLVEATGVGKQDRVLEIGPGSGMLTKCLCDAAQSVIAVEVDEAVMPFLKVKTEHCNNLTIVQGDIRKLDIQSLCEPLGEGFYVIANIPYNITTPIFELLWESGLPIRQISVMIQKEVAQKLMAAPSTSAYGLMSVKCQYYCEPSIICEVPAACFTPPPKVDSAFIRLDMREAPPLAVKDEKLLFRMLRASFSLRRKTLQNALGSVMEASKVSAALAKMGLSATVRGEALSVVEWITLANACGE